MMSKETTPKSLGLSWSSALATNSFITKFIAGWILLIVVFAYYPFFFKAIQQRQGIQLNDAVLAAIPPVDMSVPILFLIILSVAIGLHRSFRNPSVFIVFVWGYLLMSVARIFTISLVPLDPPLHLVPLADPIASPFYGQPGITKDLFFSGHTGCLFLIYLVVKKRWEKILTLITTILTGTLLLIQHIHYTVDVLAAPVFIYFIYLLAKKIANVPVKEHRF